MLGISQSVMKGELIPSANPHPGTYGPNLVDQDASTFKQYGTYLGTDPVSPLVLGSYAAQRNSAGDVGTIANMGDSLVWQTTAGQSQAMKIPLQGSGFLGADLVPGTEYLVTVSVASNFQDDNMFIRLWDGSAIILTEDLEGSTSMSDGYIFPNSEDVSVWHTVGCKFTKVVFTQTHINFNLVSGISSTYIYLDSLYVGEKI